MGGKVMTTKTIAPARNLRKRMTDAEIKLWQALRLKQIIGIRFRRQAPLGKYIVDFVSHEHKLIIELDGGQHNDHTQIKYDAQRTKWLETQGYRVQRFWNNDVLLHLDAVLDIICYVSCQQILAKLSGRSIFFNPLSQFYSISIFHNRL